MSKLEYQYRKIMEIFDKSCEDESYKKKVNEFLCHKVVYIYADMTDMEGFLIDFEEFLIKLTNAIRTEGEYLFIMNNLKNPKEFKLVNLKNKAHEESLK